MTDERMGTDDQAESSEEGPGSQDKKSTRARVGDGIKEGIGVLSAFKDAIEETIHDARERGDLSAEKAKEVMKEALDKAQQAGEKARSKLELAQQADLENVQGALDALRERVGKLEEEIFGARREPEPEPAEAPDSQADTTAEGAEEAAEEGDREA